MVASGHTPTFPCAIMRDARRGDVAEGAGEEEVTRDTATAQGGRARTVDAFISYASADKAAADSLCASSAW